MKRRFQVFVSSTFEDLKDDRQAAVEAILKAGHIPAGMELFTAGSDSQLNVIRQWIRDCDIYMLILGARYGSIEAKSGLSYTELEFDYARELGKPFFAVVLSDAGRAARVKEFGEQILERDNTSKYDAFKIKVKSQLCAFFDDSRAVKLAVFETLPQLASTPGLVGWIPSNEGISNPDLVEELTASLQEERKLRQEVERLTSKLLKSSDAVPTFEEIRLALTNKEVTYPKRINK